MRFSSCQLLLSAALLFGCGAVSAGTLSSTTGLGQSWPNAPDLSGNSHFHVYAFIKSGVRYIQVNDLNGTVRGAVGLVGDEVLELPIGIDAGRWTIVEGPDASTTGETVYRDEGTTVNAAPQADGTMRLMLIATDCKANPVACGNRGP